MGRYAPPGREGRVSTQTMLMAAGRRPSVGNMGQKGGRRTVNAQNEFGPGARDIERDLGIRRASAWM